MTGERSLPSEEPGRGDVYRRIGVEPIINGGTTFTVLGGSLMPPVVVEAMREAAACFVDLLELQAAVGARIAELTRNEAAFVSGGAAAGLFLSAAACMTRHSADGILVIGRLDGLPLEFIAHAAHRSPYDPAIELAGGRLVEIGAGPSGATEDELRATIGRATAGILIVAGEHLAAGTLPVEAMVRIAHEQDVPVIVDAAAQLPPASSLWSFTAAGADLVLFSGGKGLCGPASTGLVLGRASWVERVARNAAPLHRPGRPMKVGKEDLIGILTAVEWYLGLDHDAQSARYEAIVQGVVAWGEGRDDVDVTREWPGQAGQPTPRARIRLLGRAAARRDLVFGVLRAGRPRIELLTDGEDAFYVAPETLVAGEESIVTDRLGALLDDFAAAPDGDVPASWTRAGPVLRRR